MSEFDYYQVLQLDRTATVDDVKKAFKRLSLKYHPTKNPADITVCSDQFHQICEAYEVLSDFKARTVYDSYGSETLSRGLHRIKGTSYPGYKYKRNAFEIFEKFYHEYLPYYEIFDDKGKDLYGSCFGYAHGGILNKMTKEKPKCKHIHVELTCTLEELYNGCIKELTKDNTTMLDRHEESKVGFPEPVITYTKSTDNFSDLSCFSDEPFRVEIKPGYTNGYEITVKLDRSRDVERNSGDLKVHLKQLNHKKYSRKGDDLIYTHTIQLVDALNSSPFQLKTLDGRTLNISVDHIIAPQSVQQVEDEGMPIYDREEEIAHVE